VCIERIQVVFQGYYYPQIDVSSDHRKIVANLLYAIKGTDIIRVQRWREITM
jgi:hypothetical protein